jgi:hypothetical protein
VLEVAEWMMREAPPSGTTVLDHMLTFDRHWWAIDKQARADPTKPLST